MIIGAHVIVQSTNAEADRAFFRDVLAFPFVDEGGWPIYGLPPSEIAVHPAKKDGVHEVYLMCEDVNAFVEAMKAKKVATGKIEDQGWGIMTHITLPGGGNVGVYQPRHVRPEAPGAKPAAKKKAALPVPARAAKKSAPAKKTAAAKKSAPARKTAPAKKIALAKKTAPAKKSAPAEKSAPAKKSAKKRK